MILVYDSFLSFFLYLDNLSRHVLHVSEVLYSSISMTMNLPSSSLPQVTSLHNKQYSLFHTSFHPVQHHVLATFPSSELPSSPLLLAIKVTGECISLGFGLQVIHIPGKIAGLVRELRQFRFGGLHSEYLLLIQQQLS